MSESIVSYGFDFRLLMARFSPHYYVLLSKTLHKLIRCGWMDGVRFGLTGTSLTGLTSVIFSLIHFLSFFLSLPCGRG